MREDQQREGKDGGTEKQKMRHFHFSHPLPLSLIISPSYSSDCRILITSPSLQGLSSDPLAGLSVPHRLILSLLFSLLLLKIKDTFIALQCLIMVTQCSCLPVWSNNNSLISFYHSLSNRPKSLPNSPKTLLSPLSLSAVPFITLNLFPKHFSVSVFLSHFSFMSAVCVRVCWVKHTHTRAFFQKSFICLQK